MSVYMVSGLCALIAYWIGYYMGWKRNNKDGR